MYIDPKDPRNLIPHEELGGMSLVEYIAYQQEILNSYHKTIATNLELVNQSPALTKKGLENATKLGREQSPEAGMTFAKKTGYLDIDGKDINLTEDKSTCWMMIHPVWPYKTWYQRLGLRIKYFFIKPKLSKFNLEPAAKLWSKK